MWSVVRRNAVFVSALVLALVLLALCLPGSGWLDGWRPAGISTGPRYWLNHVQFLAGRSPGLINAYAYERPPIVSGEWWRLLTGHFMHLNLHHALMNGAGLVLLGLYFRRDFSLAGWLGLTAASCLTISAGLWWGEPDLMAYVGFSGVLHALLYAGIIQSFREMPRVNAAVLAVLVARLCWEHSAAYNPGYLMGWIHGLVAPAAHLYGALTGTIWGLVTVWLRGRAPADPTPAAALD